MSDNPYSSSSTYQQKQPEMPTPEEMRQRVKLPAMFLLLGALFNTLITSGVGFMYAFIFLSLQDQMLLELQEEQIKDLERAGMTPEGFLTVYGYVAGGSGILALIVGMVIVYGAYRMLKMKSWGLAMTAAILSLFPCFQACCLIGIPVGVYAIVTLSDPHVKEAFRQNSR